MGKRLDPKEAEAIMLKAGLKPLEPYEGNRKPWKCRCQKCKKIVEPSLSNIQQGHTGCAYCAKQKIDEKDAIKVMLKAGLKPIEPYVKSSKPWKCVCKKCGKQSSPTYGNVYMGSTCDHCANVASHKLALKSSATVIPEMLKAHLEPLEPYRGANRKWKCKCLKCGVIVYPKYGSIQSGQGGCINCMPFGINQTTPSYLYLITNQELNAHKVGIGNHKKVQDRLEKFLKKGWKTHKVWQTKTGAEALEIEKVVFKILRKDMKLPIYLSKEDMPKTEGYSETVDADSITLLQLEKIINKVIRGMK